MLDMGKVSISISDAAKEKIREIEDTGMHLRVGISKSGCCSYAFDMYPDKLRGDDELIEIDGVPLIITKEAEPFINKMDIDYRRNGVMKRFVGKAQ